MKLLACHIENFGKLSNLSLNFSEGVNIIHQSNGWGKSTLAAFLKAMFYGLDAKKEVGAFEKERILYRPWQGGVFGGELDFEIGDRQYRISRTFGRTEKTDKFHLYDLHTNLESFEYSKNIGAEIFDLDSASFKRTIFIAQNDCLSSVSDCINAKLGNLAENTDDINNFDSASNHLKDILNRLTPERVTGSLKKRKNYMTQLTQELRTFDSAQEGLEGVKKKVSEVSDEIEKMLGVRQNYAQDLVTASEDSRKKELYRQYDALCKETEEKEEVKNKLEEIFPNGVPTKEELKEQLQNARNMENSRARQMGVELTVAEQKIWEGLQITFENELPNVQQMDDSLEMLAAVEKQKENLASLEIHMNLLQREMEKEQKEPSLEKISHKIPLFAGLGMVLTGVFMLFFRRFPVFSGGNQTYLLVSAVVVMVLGIIVSLIGILQGGQARKEKEAWRESVLEERERLQKRYKDLEEQAVDLKVHMHEVYGTVGAFLNVFHIECEAEAYSAKLYELKSQLAQYERLVEKMEEITKEKEIFAQEKAKIDAFMERYGCEDTEDVSAVLSYYHEKATEFYAAEQAYQEAYKKREEFEQQQENAFWTRKALCPYSLEEVNHRIQQTDVKIEELKNAKIQYERQLESLQEQLDLRDEKQAELEEQMQQQEEDAKKYRIVKLTQEYLTKAKQQFTARYMDPIANAFSKYYKILTKEENGAWSIDANIHLKMKEQGELRETGWLSAGYQDLLGICMRLALTDAMYKEEKPFLILDDPFVNLDQEKTTAGNQLLSTAANEYQIIYFTCHESRMPDLKDNRIKKLYSRKSLS